MLALILAAAAGTVQPSFDCARAATLVETTICGDESLAVRDRALALAYRRTRHETGAMADQARWITERNACTTSACLQFAYDRRIEDLLGESAPAPRALTRTSRDGWLEMIDVGGGWRLWVIDAIYTRPNGGSTNTGGGAGVVHIVGGRGIWRGEQECVVLFTRQRTGWRIRQPNHCPNGLNVTMAGLYR